MTVCLVLIEHKEVVHEALLSLQTSTLTASFRGGGHRYRKEIKTDA